MAAIRRDHKIKSAVATWPEKGSERASYITGTTIQVDGGLVRGLL